MKLQKLLADVKNEIAAIEWAENQIKGNYKAPMKHHDVKNKKLIYEKNYKA